MEVQEEELAAYILIYISKIFFLSMHIKGGMGGAI